MEDAPATFNKGNMPFSKGELTVNRLEMLIIISVVLNTIPKLASNLNFEEDLDIEKDLDVEEDEFMAADDPAMGEGMPCMGTMVMAESIRRVVV
ncbi:serine-threonine protein kinase, plant-type [Dorcoceras hygrometricum]|uniref:Serine-threonine protein kinase, plant-type n=1 Tax=Dorcoceras hygrometricum TaxID=472368 RepID=A0A2Z7CHX8_9LAMI|nr:serine-threonine protein kinase, plant-type [Dorcoceras hygrometricum]